MVWAKELIALYGNQKLRKLLPTVVSSMKKRNGFPNAKNFGATRSFFPQVISIHEQEMQRRRDDQLKASQEVIENRRDSESREERKLRRGKLLKIWEALSSEEQTKIEQKAFERQNGTLLKDHFQNNDKHRKRECLKELGRQQQKMQ